MQLKLKVDTTAGDGPTGTLLFESSDKKMEVSYFFDSGKPHKSLEKGDEVGITFKIGDEEFPVRGIFPEILREVPPRAQCFWALAYQTICNNVFHIFAGTEMKTTDIMSVSQDISGEVNDATAKVLFG